MSVGRYKFENRTPCPQVRTTERLTQSHHSPNLKKWRYAGAGVWNRASIGLGRVEPTAPGSRRAESTSAEVVETPRTAATLVMMAFTSSSDSSGTTERSSWVSWAEASTRANLAPSRAISVEAAARTGTELAAGRAVSSVVI
ncbi:hypothetical protein KPH14_000765 [Odynerus spinipes]|uniref:Uncharacterized protein n=1 Tax=Odynerus spinipes TaxID=1348599 RepID=A0AAD9VLM7_9HYME|nr:hypothetical protein KPH14_000765 [Odynerus spinipes]